LRAKSLNIYFTPVEDERMQWLYECNVFDIVSTNMMAAGASLNNLSLFFISLVGVNYLFIIAIVES